MRVGFGYDVHRLTEGRPLILGGVTVPNKLGLLGHSDADVLIHAIIDALLGAAGLGDIGAHYPPSEAAYKDISSVILLERTAKTLKDSGYVLSNIDATIVCESPKLSPYIPTMVDHMAKALGATQGHINIKATTTEGLGFAGTGEGIAAYAVALITKEEPKS
jgi:2-C-methyl-D-erythritol 2,4-cyclodiphosphate synthase